MKRKGLLIVLAELPSGLSRACKNRKIEERREVLTRRCGVSPSLGSSQVVSSLERSGKESVHEDSEVGGCVGVVALEVVTGGTGHKGAVAWCHGPLLAT